MADEKPNQPSRAEQIRRRSAAQEKDVVAAFEIVAKTPPAGQLNAAMQALGVAFVWALSYIPEIAAQLAERNERDTAAEIRMKDMRSFVEGIQAEIARQQATGIVLPGAVQMPTPRRGK